MKGYREHDMKRAKEKILYVLFWILLIAFILIASSFIK